jgi:hypothetical protein
MISVQVSNKKKSPSLNQCEDDVQRTLSDVLKSVKPMKMEISSAAKQTIDNQTEAVNLMKKRAPLNECDDENA